MKAWREIFVVFFSFLFYSGISQVSAPVAMNDSLIVYVNSFYEDTIHEYHVTQNDFDPQGMNFKIKDVWRQGYEKEEVLFNDSVIYVPYYSPTDLIEKVYHYRIQQIDDPFLVSDWARLYTNPSRGITWPVARADTVFVIRGHTADLNLLENDHHPLDDTSHIGIFSYGEVLSDSVVRVFGNPYIEASSFDTYYFLTDTSNWFYRHDVGIVHFQLSNNHFYDSLALNNINARFYCYGHHFWDFDNHSCFFVPNGSNTPSIFNQTLWIGGLDEQEQLHTAGERYRGDGADYRHGPVSESYDSLFDLRWYHIWNLKQDEIEYHKMNWNASDYEPIDDILSWPANGDSELGQAANIAPFEDLNGNGWYEPLLGESPIIRGDQALYFVFNDDRYPHEESGGIPLGIEIRGMAYAFDAPQDSILWNTIFLHYDIINRSDTAYHDVYLGIFTDTKLGYGWDDYIESDVMNGMYFTYNGDEYDQNTGSYNGYGFHPPAQGIMMLAGPYMDPDGQDNPRFDILGNQILNESINGMNFGDGMIDNERLGMRSFIYFHGSTYGDDPTNPQKYYNYLRGFWVNGSDVFYGGGGHIISGAVGPRCRYMFPRNSDPNNWGTFGLYPNQPFNPDDVYWSDEQSQANPGYRRGIGAMGPFTLAPGQSQPLDLSFPWARDYDGTSWESALLLKERAAIIRQLFESDSAFMSDVQNPKSLNKNDLRIHPNPATATIRITYNGEKDSEFVVDLIDLHGRILLEKQYENMRSALLDIRELHCGVYILRIRNADFVHVLKFIKQ